MVTTILNRSLLRMRKAEVLQLRSRSLGATSPFGISSEMETRPNDFEDELPEIATWRSGRGGGKFNVHELDAASR
jgi:hypothetical protein